MSAGRQLLGVLAVGCLLCAIARAQERFSAEAVKAAYLYRITSFVQWPGTHRSDAPFTIDVLGDPAMAAELAQLLPDHRVQGHPARLRVITRISELGDAQMLYIGPRFGGNIRAAIAAIAYRPVLVVTDEARGSPTAARSTSSSAIGTFASRSRLPPRAAPGSTSAPSSSRSRRASRGRISAPKWTARVAPP